MSHNILAPILVKVKSDSKKRKKTWSWRPQGGYPPETPVRVGPLKKLALYAPSRGVLVTEMTPRENFGVRTSYSEKFGVRKFQTPKIPIGILVFANRISNRRRISL